MTNRDGRLVIGDVTAVGTSRVRAGNPADPASLVNQTVFAKSIEIQGPAGDGVLGSKLNSELKATGAQVITTLAGYGIDVTGGSGDNTLAQIDPILQTILSNGSILIEGGTGVNSVAQIVAATGTTPNGQTILTTSGNIDARRRRRRTSACASSRTRGSSSFVGTSGSIELLTAEACPGQTRSSTSGMVRGADVPVRRRLHAAAGRARHRPPGSWQMGSRAAEQSVFFRAATVDCQRDESHPDRRRQPRAGAGRDRA